MKMLRTIRRRQKRTLAQVAEQTGLSISYLSDLEHGRTQPSMRTLHNLARCLAVGPAALLDGLEGVKRLKHGDSVEAWAMHEVRIVCPTCRRMLSRNFKPFSRFYPIISCECGQAFKIDWESKADDPIVTIHTFVDIDIPEMEEASDE